MPGRLWRRLRALLFKRAAERELDAELRYHLERETEQNVAAGMTALEARRAALRGFGGVEQSREECRDARGVRVVEELWQDLRYGVRMLRKNPGFTLVAVFTLALGIGANTAIFSVVNAVLLRPLSFANPERLVTLWGKSTDTGADRIPLSYLNFTDYKNQAQSFEHVAACDTSEAVLTSPDGEPESLNGARVSADLFPLLGVAPALGRAFSAEEDRPGGAAVVVISHGLWQRRFASDPQVVGREIVLGERSTKVVGVMQQGFTFPVEEERADYWVPLAGDPNRAQLLSNRHGKFLTIVARLKPGVRPEQAEAEMEVIARRLEAQYPDANTGWRTRLVPLQEDIVGGVRPALLILLGAVALVLLIACANVANLLLARAGARGREIAIRRALGAGRARIVRQLLTESLLLSLAGGGLGLLLAEWLIDVIVAAGPASLPRLADVNLDAKVLGFTLIVSALTGLVFGLAPAFRASKTGLGEPLKEGGRSSTEGARRNSLRGLLVVSEVALSLMLLVGAGLLIKSFVRLLRTDPGYQTERVLTASLSLSKTKYPEPEQQAAAYQQVLRRVAALPGVEAAGAASLLPLGGRDSYNVFQIEGRAPFAAGQGPNVRSQVVSPDYFRAMGIQLRRGRSFTEGDTKDSRQVVIINEAFARRHFSGEDPVAERLVIGDEPPREIVGVVGSVRHRGLEEEPQPEFYVSYLQAPRSRLSLVVRAASIDPAKLADAVRGAVREVEKDQLVGEVRTMDTLVAHSVAPRRFQMLLMGSFAAVALLLAGVGIYGVMAYAVTQRRHEIGVRLALGAQRGDVIRLVVRQGMTPALLGAGIGLIGAFAGTRVIESLLYGVSAGDPLVFAGVSVLLLLTALLACYLPARRATGIDPAIALRHE
ncbi:MAG TPA: ABC transporter permease [Pyrinomonadaceae bacterium]|nr:ABC transporter permease [Pyrinomonadaceae bacterium]